MQRFLSVHGPVQNLFRVGRHLLRAVHYRFFRTQAFGVWHEVTCVQITGLSRCLIGGGACLFNVKLIVSIILPPIGVAR